MLNADTPITVRTYNAGPAEVGETATMTWDAFVASNDAETVDDARFQIEFDGYAKLGGGAAPIVWVFA